MKIKAIFLDCDGTIAETEAPITLTQFNRAFEVLTLQKNFPIFQWSIKEYAELLKTGDSIQRYLSFFDTQSLWPIDVVEGKLTKLQFAKYMQNLKNEQFDVVFEEAIRNNSIKLRPGIERLVRDAFYQGIPVAVCSNSLTLPVQAIVDKLLVFDGNIIPVYGGDSVIKKKPHPEIYQLAAERFGISSSDYNYCAVIEDSNMGLASAKAAGMFCVITKSTFTSEEDFSLADVIVDDLETGGITLDKLNEIVIAKNKVMDG